MNRDDFEARLQHDLRRPEPPAGLREQLKANLHQQAASERRRPAAPRLVATAVIVAYVALAGVLWTPVAENPPALIAAARAHAVHEQTLSGVKTVALDPWRDRIGLAQPPADALLLIKDCVVAGIELKHLRLRLDTGGSADLLIDASGGLRPMADAGAGRGWLLTHAREDTTLLLLYAPDDAFGAARMLQSLFPDAGLSIQRQEEV